MISVHGVLNWTAYTF